MYAGVNEKPLLYLSNVLHEYSIIPEVWMFASTAEIFFDFHPSMQLLPCESFHKNFTENVFNLLKCIQQLKYNDTLSFMLSWELTEMGKMHFKGTWKTHWGGGRFSANMIQHDQEQATLHQWLQVLLGPWFSQSSWPSKNYIKICLSIRFRQIVFCQLTLFDCVSKFV